MKKFLVSVLFVSIVFIGGCDILCGKAEKEITETFGNRTCVGKGIDKIEGYAECISSYGNSYIGDVRGHTFNGKGKLVNSNGDIHDGYFYEGDFIAGKVTWNNGNAAKGLRLPHENGGFTLELGKVFMKSNGYIELGEYDYNGGLKYGMTKFAEIFSVGDFGDIDNYGFRSINNGYTAMPSGCYRAINGKLSEITKTVTNTVYRNNGINLSNSSPLGDFYKLGSKYNPYTVQLELK